MDLGKPTKIIGLEINYDQVQQVTRSTERRRLHQALHEWERWNQAHISDRWDTQQDAAMQGSMI
jgi:hypothetical protein